MSLTINPEKKYTSLSEYFSKADFESVTLTFQEIEQIMGHQLPNAAYLNKSWWKKTKAPARHFRAWTNAGFAVESVEPGQRVVFVLADPSSSDPASPPSVKDLVLVRPAELDDARSFITLQKTVEAASPFMLYQKDERNPSTQQIRKQMAEWKKAGHSAILLAIINGKPAGYLIFLGNPAERAAHRAALVLGVLPQYQRKGAGFALLEKAEEWAAAKSISRLELTVAAENTAARRLYEKAGFTVEGTRKQALLIDGVFHDEFYMAKLLS